MAGDGTRHVCSCGALLEYSLMRSWRASMCTCMATRVPFASIFVLDEQVVIRVLDYVLARGARNDKGNGINTRECYSSSNRAVP